MHLQGMVLVHPCRLPLKLWHCKFSQHRVSSNHTEFHNNKAFRNARSTGFSEHPAFQDRTRIRKRTGSRRTTKTIAAAGSGTVSDVAQEVMKGGKGPVRGRRFLPAVPPAPIPEREEGAMRVFLISDIHTDYQENLEWLQNLSQTSFLNDALIVAGDVSDSIPRFEETFRILRPKFAHVFFTPGNHDLWVRTSEPSPTPTSGPSFEASNGTSSEASSEPLLGTTSKPNSEEVGADSPSKPFSGTPCKPALHPVLETISTLSPPPVNSMTKLATLFKICEELGVDTRPKFLTAHVTGKGNNEVSGQSGVRQGLESSTQSKRLESGVENGSNGVSKRTGEGEDLRVSVRAIGASRESEGTSFRTGGSEEGGSSGVPFSNEALKEDVLIDGAMKDGVSKGGSSLAEAQNGGNSLEGASRNGDPEAGPLQIGQEQRLPDLTRGDGNGAEASTCKPRAASRKGAAEQGETGVWVVPILSWHHISFDTEPNIPGYNIPPIEKVAKDHKVCKWPSGWDPMTESVAQAFDAMNDELHRDFEPASTPGCQVITFSHFLPRLELIPEKRFLFYPNLAKAVGSHSLEARVRSIHGQTGGGSALHLFGHTHFSWDMTLEGIRYIQAPLAYPRERKRRMNGGEDWLPLCIYDSSRGGVLKDEQQCHWSDHYKTHPREPNNFEFAPWVSKLWKPIRNKEHTLV